MVSVDVKHHVYLLKPSVQAVDRRVRVGSVVASLALCILKHRWSHACGLIGIPSDFLFMFALAAKDFIKTSASVHNSSPYTRTCHRQMVKVLIIDAV